MSMNRRKYNATVTYGEARTLQGNGSEVSLTIPRGVHGVCMTTVHTDHTMFPHVIPESECIVGPLVEVEHVGKGAEKERSLTYMPKIPHCIQNKELWKSIKVRRGNPKNGIDFTDLQQRFQPGDDGDYYVIDEKFITIYTSHFTLFTCTSCNNSCNATIMTFLVAQLRHLPKYDVTKVKAKVFLCSDLYRIEDFRNVCHL